MLHIHMILIMDQKTNMVLSTFGTARRQLKITNFPLFRVKISQIVMALIRVDALEMEPDFCQLAQTF